MLSKLVTFIIDMKLRDNLLNNKGKTAKVVMDRVQRERYNKPKAEIKKHRAVLKFEKRNGMHERNHTKTAGH